MGMLDTTYKMGRNAQPADTASIRGVTQGGITNNVSSYNGGQKPADTASIRGVTQGGITNSAPSYNGGQQNNDSNVGEMTRYMGSVRPPTTALSQPQDYQNVINFAKGNTQSPNQQHNVQQNETSAGQLANITNQDSPLMQQAALRGSLQASSRGLLNSSMAAGASQAAMVNAAQPFALQDAATYAKAASDNTAAANQFQQIGYQSGLDTVKQSYIDNAAAANRNISAGYQSQLDTAKTGLLANQQTNNNIRQIGVQSAADRDRQIAVDINSGQIALNNGIALDNNQTANKSLLSSQISSQDLHNALAISTNQNELDMVKGQFQAGLTRAENHAAAYDDYLSKMGLQDSEQAFSRWKTTQDNKTQMELADVNGGYQLKSIVQQGQNALETQNLQNQGSLADTNAQGAWQLQNTDKQGQNTLANTTLQGQNTLTNTKQQGSDNLRQQALQNKGSLESAKAGTIADLNRQDSSNMTSLTQQMGTVIQNIRGNAQMADEASRTNAIQQAIAPMVVSYNQSAVRLGYAPMSVYDFMGTPQQVSQGVNSSAIANLVNK